MGFGHDMICGAPVRFLWGNLRKEDEALNRNRPFSGPCSLGSALPNPSRFTLDAKIQGQNDEQIDSGR